VPFCLQGFLPPPRTSPRLLVECVPRRWLARYCFTASHRRLWFGFTANTSSASSSCFTVAPSMFLTSTVAMLVVSGQLSVVSYHCRDRLLTPLISPGTLSLSIHVSCLPIADCLLPTVTYAAPWLGERLRNCPEDPAQHPRLTTCFPPQVPEPRADYALSPAHGPYGPPPSSP